MLVYVYMNVSHNSNRTLQVINTSDRYYSVKHSSYKEQDNASLIYNSKDGMQKCTFIKMNFSRMSFIINTMQEHEAMIWMN